MGCNHGCCVLCAALARAVELGTKKPGTHASVLMRGEVRAQEGIAGPMVRYSQIWVFQSYQLAEEMKRDLGGGMLQMFEELFPDHGKFFAEWHLAPGGEIKIIEPDA